MDYKKFKSFLNQSQDLPDVSTEIYTRPLRQWLRNRAIFGSLQGILWLKS